jgi:hypothetical protein
MSGEGRCSDGAGSHQGFATKYLGRAQNQPPMQDARPPSVPLTLRRPEQIRQRLIQVRMTKAEP